jgi:hypothetical protein
MRPPRAAVQETPGRASSHRRKKVQAAADADIWRLAAERALIATAEAVTVTAAASRAASLRGFREALLAFRGLGEVGPRGSHFPQGDTRFPAADRSRNSQALLGISYVFIPRGHTAPPTLLRPAPVPL